MGNFMNILFGYNNTVNCYGIIKADTLCYSQDQNFSLRRRYLAVQCLDMLRSMPMPTRRKASELPPAVKNGKGIPVTGMEDVTTATLLIT